MTAAKSPACPRETATGLVVRKRAETDRVVALAGNPNVGKSTIFNSLTGMRQHTGNWPGKTVANAQGHCIRKGQGYVMVDIPGCYSLMAHSAEEEVARDFVCFGAPDAVIVVCDATCLERNLNLVLQVMEASSRVVVGVNLMDEARKKRISVDLAEIARRLNTPVIGMAARSGRGIDELMAALENSFSPPKKEASILVRYPDYLERALAVLTPELENACQGRVNARWLSARLLEQNDRLLASAQAHLGFDPQKVPSVSRALEQASGIIQRSGVSPQQLRDDLAAAFVTAAAQICQGAVRYEKGSAHRRDRLLDRLFTSRATGFPIMLLLLLGVFWLTISGANYPSTLLARGLFWLEDQMAAALLSWNAPPLLIDLIIHGAYRVMAWVVSVMLPPMAIFFPLFTLLEDFGYLPRVAFNLDRCFKGCRACGKQSLTMCLGLGCNAAGVTGCRIIDSPRERLIAIITNSFMPCNGRFPAMISLISLFLIGGLSGVWGSLAGAAILVGVIVLGVAMTLAVSRLLSGTLLKGIPSSFALELPPYRRPQVGRVIVRSVVDRTLKVLLRAVAVAAPAGAVIWILANVSVNGVTLLSTLTRFLDPLGQLMGMDGTILTGFILGLPANEIVIPIIIMGYLAQGSLTEVGGAELLNVLSQNGWTWITALCVILFSLMHWPCATTCATIYKETKSVKWTLVSFLTPTLCGMAACMLVNLAASLLS